MEYNAWGEPKNPPEHEANLVFTRMLSGPMDFTPGVLSLKGKDNTPILSTLGEAAGALHRHLFADPDGADLPENYAANPKTFQFIKDVAVDWDDTRMLAGEVGDLAVIRSQAARLAMTGSSAPLATSRSAISTLRSTFSIRAAAIVPKSIATATMRIIEPIRARSSSNSAS